MIKNLLFTIYIFSFLFLFVQTSYACSCAFKDLKNTFSSADAVFIGKVVGVKTVKMASVGLIIKESGTLESLKTPRLEKSIDKVQSVMLEVSESFKGTNEKVFTLITHIYNGGGTCGVRFRLGESYLVFAHKRQSLLSNEDATQPKENRTLEMRLNAEADKFNERLPKYGTSICSRTENSRFMKDELVEIRDFLKNGKWEEYDQFSPFMPPLQLFLN